MAKSQAGTSRRDDAPKCCALIKPLRHVGGVASQLPLQHFSPLYPTVSSPCKCQRVACPHAAVCFGIVKRFPRHVSPFICLSASLPCPALLCSALHCLNNHLQLHRQRQRGRGRESERETATELHNKTQTICLPNPTSQRVCDVM